jgi:hypothetical protein
MALSARACIFLVGSRATWKLFGPEVGFAEIIRTFPRNPFLAKFRVPDNPLGNPRAQGDNHSSVVLGDHELISFQCHLDTLHYVEDPVFQPCRISR